MKRPEAVIIDAVRTPIGKYGGVLRDVRPDDMSALVIRAIMERTNLDPSMIEDVIWGCSNQAGEDSRNVGRMSALLAGLPYTVPATSVNRLCGSGIDAIIHAGRAVWSEDLEIVIAGGVESMSRAPYSIPKNQSGGFGNITAFDTALGWRYPNPKMEKMFPLESMGETAENIAVKYKISRADQDTYAYQSHSKAVRAQKDLKFQDELVPVPVLQKHGREILIEQDEGPRADTSVDVLATLKPAFRKNGTVTAGNSSSLNDGAAAVLIVSENIANRLQLKPMARILSTATIGVDPQYMGIGPVPAVNKALRKAALTLQQLELIELNEAFSAQCLAVIRQLDIDPTTLNVNGGAIALGHPLGCSGARILTTLLHEMRRRKSRYGMATMCIGVGQGIAIIVEAL